MRRKMASVQIKKRKSNIELLRIFAILLIIINHLSLHTPWNVEKTANVARLTTQWLASGGRLGVNIFVLITGYFLIKSRFKWRSLSKLWLQVWLYAVALFFVFRAMGEPISYNQIRISFLPIFYNQWWFITAYVIMYLFVPFINKFILSLTKKELRRFLGLTLIVGSIWPTLAPKISIYSDVTWMIFVYIIGAYIRIYPEDFNKIKTRTILIYFSMIGILSVCSIQLMNWFNSLPANFLVKLIRSIGISNTRLANAPMSPLSLSLAVLILLIFLRLHIPYSKFINTLAANVFGVYLLQSNTISHKWLWRVVNAQQFTDAWQILTYAILITIIIFSVGSLIVWLTNFIVKPLEELIFGSFDNYQQANIKIKE